MWFPPSITVAFKVAGKLASRWSLSQEYTEWCNQLDPLRLREIKKGKNKFHTVFELATIFLEVCLTLKGVYTETPVIIELENYSYKVCFFLAAFIQHRLIDIRDIWKLLMSQLNPPEILRVKCRGSNATHWAPARGVRVWRPTSPVKSVDFKT